jgi:hypothetical protein
MKTATPLLKGFAAFMTLFLAFYNQAGAQVRVTRLNTPDELSGKNGIVYNLPRTVVHVAVRVAKTQQFAGPLAGYAADYLGVDNVATKSEVSFAIAGVEISTVSEPDPNQVFIIEKEDKSPAEIWVSFGNQAPVAVLEKFEKEASPGGFVEWNQDLFVKPDPALLFRKYTDSPTREVIDTITRIVSIDTLVIEQNIFKRSMVEFTDIEKAQEAAAQIRQIERDKYNLLIGYQETAYSRETLEFMLSELEKQRQEYLKLFTGVNVTETILFDFTIIPDNSNEEGNYIVSGFTKAAGIGEAEGQNIISLGIRRDNPEVKIPELKDGLAMNGLVYRVPQPVTAVLTYQGKEIVSKRIEVLQLSPMLALPSGFKRVEFDMQTGALKSVVLE